ncbi:hypothetical protein HOT49_gp194 [Erwinia phage vB_EamM_Alexandra]|uniref:Uncharacterized protein n=1 Tax=Erwinia phage vB_EamM_Alexandra TaxID=2201424 RepID=A0A2Z4QER8_9CAUD|nr:hypothetical protein HOT49_gp194 [Erwinia phage vB_EamM_Alexandra]AWY08607.1 hypothetical protein Alexandra_196 [Erwinia phage vB_EamM_Alexandra]
MQYLSSFTPLNEAVHPAVMFFDDHDDLPEFAVDTIDDTLRLARTVLGTNNQLNPVRGRADDNYYLTFLKYAKNGESPYSAPPTISTASSNVGVIHHHVSNGGDEYRQGPTAYSYQAAQNRVSVLNPGYVESILYPTWKAEDSGTFLGRSYSVRGLYSDGATLSTKSIPFTNSPAGGILDISPVFSDVTDSVLFVDCLSMWTYPNSASQNGVHRPYQNSGPVQYRATGENLTAENEAINLSHAVMVMADNVFMRLLKGVDFEVDVYLTPGTRPYIQLSKSTIHI